MQTKEFEEFVASQQGSDVDAEIDWAKIRDEWLIDLSSLYDNVVGYLRKYIDAGSISYNFTDIELSEPEIGEYIARRMDIRIGRQRVSLVPVGTMLVACKGRVDAVGSAGRAQILLINSKAKTAADLFKITVTVNPAGAAPPPPPQQPVEWAWKILTNAVQGRFEDLNQDSFFNLLMEIANA